MTKKLKGMKREVGVLGYIIQYSIILITVIKSRLARRVNLEPS
jgi:hypothetical protein